jgi:hypothetical protein
MLQTMRTRPIWLARNLLALWFVLFFACSFAHADAPSAAANAAASHAEALLTSPCHGQHDLINASSDTCNALQNSPRNQPLLTMLLGLAILSGLIATFTPLGTWRRPYRLCGPGCIAPAGPHPFVSNCIAITNSATLRY